MIPEWEPPAGLTDPLVRRLHVDRAKWNRTIRGRLRMTSDYAVAYALADYANKDGSRAHPGTTRLADELAASPSTVKRALSWLAENGWITVTHRGRRKLGEANVHQLAIPAPVAVEIGLWHDSNGAQWMQRPADQPARPSSRGHPRPLERASSTGHPRPLEPVSRGHEDGSRGHMGPFLGVTHDPPPGSTHPDLKEHTSDRLDRPHAAARGRAGQSTPTAWVRDDPEALIEQIEERFEDETGEYPDGAICSLISGMVHNGQHPEAILNTARAECA